MTFCIFHDWEKKEEAPREVYLDSSGIQVGIFTCQCRRCGKTKARKFMGPWRFAG